MSLITSQASFFVKRVTIKLTRGHSYPKDDMSHPPAALEKIVSYFHRVTRPVYVGFVSVEIGYSLERTEAMMALLADAGVIRPLTTDEKASLRIVPSYHVWALAKRA
jgi:hypothetical protein